MHFSTSQSDALGDGVVINTVLSCFVFSGVSACLPLFSRTVLSVSSDVPSKILPLLPLSSRGAECG